MQTEKLTQKFNPSFKEISLLAKALYIETVIRTLGVEDLDELIEVHENASEEEIWRAVEELENKGLLKKPVTLN